MFNAVPIGVVHSPAGTSKSMPPMGVPASIEIYPRYLDGLRHLERHSHVWVLGWFDRAERDLLDIVPRGLHDEKWGVFAVRSPARPNPIGLTAARIERIEPPRIHVDRLDFLDGTPVIDIKPYFLNRDLIFSAANTQIGRPADRATMRDSLLLQAERFHGELCPGLATAVRIVEHYRATKLDMRDGEAWLVSAPPKWPCILDALMGLTRTTPGRKDLLLRDGDTVEIATGHAGAVRYRPLAPHEDASRILALPDDDIFET